MSDDLDTLVANTRLWIAEQTAKQFSDASVKLALNRVARRIHNKLGTLDDTRWLIEIATAIPVVADTEEYNQPTGMVNIHAVQVWGESGDYEPMDPLPPSEWERGIVETGVITTVPRWYMLLKDTVILRPKPTAAIANGIRFIGTCEYTDMSAGSDTTGLPAQLDAPTEFGAASLLMLSEGESLAGAFQALHESWLAEAIDNLSRRDEAPQRMHDRDDYGLRV